MSYKHSCSYKIGVSMSSIFSDGLYFFKENAPYPNNLLRLFFRNNLARQKITSKNKNNLARLFFTLVLKGIFGGVLKITSENKMNF